MRVLLLTDICSCVDKECVDTFLDDVDTFIGGIRRELADDFFEDIFERHDSLDITVFIDDEGDVAELCVEAPDPVDIAQVVEESFGLWHEEPVEVERGFAEIVDTLLRRRGAA